VAEVSFLSEAQIPGSVEAADVSTDATAVPASQKEILSFSANLDLLRSIAVLSVFAAHLAPVLGLANPGSLGRFGVILFFVHTSLVLMASLARMDSSCPGEPWKLIAAFAIRRFFRIYPLSMITVLVVILFRIASSPGLTYTWIGWPHVASNLALTQNLTNSPYVLAVLWTLPLEIQMYCFLPFIYLFIRRSSYRPLVIWVLAVIAAVTAPRISLRLGMFTVAPCFVAGIVAYGLHKVIRPRWPSWIWLCAILLAICLYGPLDDISLARKLKMAWVLTLALAVVFPFCREIRGRFLSRACHTVAKYSYGIYLSHSIVFTLALYTMAGAPPSVRLLLLAGGCIILPVAMYHLIEHPLIRVGSALADRL
jgi:peptidoglycan/LPS O-acetylase OafA/YrhL